MHTDGASPGHVHSSARVESVHTRYRASSGSCVCSGVRVRSGSRLLLVSPPIAPDSSVAPPPGSPLPATPSWHALPSSFRLQLRERFGQDLPVLRLHSDRGGEFSSSLLRDFCRGEGILQSFMLPDTPQQNGIAERRIGLVIEVARTSMIHAAAPHFLWPFAVRYAAHQLNLWPRVSLPKTSPTLRWTGKVGDASVFRVWGSRAFVRDTSADKLSPRAIPCVFLGFVPDAPGWQFYHPTSRRIFPSQDVTFDELVPFYRLFPYRSAPSPPPLLFLAPGPPPVDPLLPQGPAPSSVSQVDPLPGPAPVQVALGSGAARDVVSGGAGPRGAASGGAGPGGAESEGAETGGAEPGGVEHGGGEPGGTEPEGVEPGGAASEGAESGDCLRSSCGSGLFGTHAFVLELLQLEGTGAAGTGGVEGAGAGDPTESSATGAGGSGAGGTRAGGAGVGGTGAGGAGVGGPCVEGAGARGDGVVDPGGAPASPLPAPSPYTEQSGDLTDRCEPMSRPVLPICTARRVPRSLLQQVVCTPSSTGLTPPLLCPPPDQSQPQLQPASPLPAPSPYTEQSGGLTERREPASRPASLVCTARRVPRTRPPPIPGTHAMTLRPSSVPLRVPPPAPPVSSLPEVPDPESDCARAASPTVSPLLATAVTDPSFESAAASALIAELLDIAAACRLDYATALAVESASATPPSVGGECALSTDFLEDRQEVFEYLAAAVPRLASMLLAPEGDPDAPDIPTPRSYAEAIEGPYSSQRQATMDVEMASRKSTGTYVDEVPPPGANTFDGMWIFRVKRPPGFPPVFKRDYELHYLDFSTAFLQGSLHEEIWLRRPPSFTESFPAGTQWSLRRPVYGLRQAPREWHDTLRTTLATLWFAPATADPSLFLRTDTLLPPFYVLVYVDDLVFATAETEELTLVKSELQKRHTCTDLGELRSYLGLQITRDKARRTITMTHSHMVHQVLQRFGFQFSSPQPTPLTSRLGLVLGGRGPVVLTGHADASWELRWLTYLLTDLGEQPRSPPVLYVDNKAMIALCQGHRVEHRMKHIALRYFLARELQQRGQLRLAYVATRANTADIFTKALTPGDHKRSSTVLGLVPTLPHLLTT
ncbi:unnamed protein product [Closterium sp. NIES-54]